MERRDGPSKQFGRALKAVSKQTSYYTWRDRSGFPYTTDVFDMSDAVFPTQQPRQVPEVYWQDRAKTSGVAQTPV